MRRLSYLIACGFFLFTFQAYGVSGTLKDENKRPVPYAYLTIYGDQEVAATCRTNRLGIFQVSGLLEDSYHILIRVGNKAQMVYFVYMDEKEEVELSINLSGKSGTGHTGLLALLGGPPLDLAEFDLGSIPLADGFDFPVGKPDGKGYYIAQHFRTNDHLGDDWNGNGGGNTDLGDAISSIGDGMVVAVYDAGEGWGGVIRVIHKVGKQDSPRYIESLYAHMKTMGVKKGDLVKRGQFLGTMGNANGSYYAHLHLELRARIGMPLGGGYGPSGHFINPTAYIIKNRPRKK